MYGVRREVGVGKAAYRTFWSCSSWNSTSRLKHQILILMVNTLQSRLFSISSFLHREHHYFPLRILKHPRVWPELWPALLSKHVLYGKQLSRILWGPEMSHRNVKHANFFLFHVCFPRLLIVTVRNQVLCLLPPSFSLRTKRKWKSRASSTGVPLRSNCHLQPFVLFSA